MTLAILLSAGITLTETSLNKKAVSNKKLETAFVVELLCV